MCLLTCVVCFCLNFVGWRNGLLVSLIWFVLECLFIGLVVCGFLVELFWMIFYCVAGFYFTDWILGCGLLMALTYGCWFVGFVSLSVLLFYVFGLDLCCTY